jgi:hypothetical protein
VEPRFLLAATLLSSRPAADLATDHCVLVVSTLSRKLVRLREDSAQIVQTDAPICTADRRPPCWLYEGIFASIDRLQLHERTAADYAIRISWRCGTSRAFAYPSIYEGFGIPPPRACGTPIVVSDN